MNLFDQILGDLVDPQFKTADVMRKAFVLAYSLNSAEFKSWVDQELNGYKDANIVPHYRKLQAVVYGNVSIGYMIINRQQLPTYLLPNGLEDKCTKVNLVWPVGQIETTIHEPSFEGFYFGVPAEFLAIASSYMPYSVVHSAHIFVGTPFGFAILEAVRNGLLRFILELKDAHPEAATSDEALKAIPSREVAKTFMTNIYGGVHGSNLALNDSTVSDSSAG